MGARTVSSDPEWKCVNLRRHFAYLERSIDRGTQWAVFEPYGERLWANVRRTIEDFLLNEWQMGALLGDKPEKAPQRVGPLGLAPGHARHLQALPDDAQVHGDAFDADARARWRDVLAPRCPAAGDGAGHSTGLCIVHGIAALPGAALPAWHSGDHALQHDGLLPFDVGLFTDPALAGSAAGTLLADADFLRFGAQPPRAPTGQQAALAIAEVSLLADTTGLGRGACGARYSVEGLRFRRVAIDTAAAASLLPAAIDPGGAQQAALRSSLQALLAASGGAARERLRNLQAHACYGSVSLVNAFCDPLRERRDLGDCDVPLTLVVLDSQGIRLLDVWAVRRKLAGEAAVNAWQTAAGPRRMAEGEAAYLQFQAQLEGLRAPGGVAAGNAAAKLAASRCLDILPAAGWLAEGPGGFAWPAFLGPHARPTRPPPTPHCCAA